MTQDFLQRDLKGKNIVVTGASKGLGKRLSEKLNDLGASLFLLARNKTGDLDELISQLKKTNDQVYGFSCDTSSSEDIQATFQKISQLVDHLDVLVCNSGIMPGIFEGMHALSDEMDKSTLRTNVEGYYFCTKYALPLLSKSKDFDRTIVYVSSDAGWLTNPPIGLGMLSYCVSKAADNALAVAVHSNYVVENEATLKVRKPEERLHRVVSMHPGFVATTLGSETLNMPIDQMGEIKKSIGAISIDDGVDTLYWLVAAKEGVESGKTYYQRKVVPF